MIQRVWLPRPPVSRMDSGSLDPCVGSRQMSITHITGIASIVYHTLMESQNREIVEIVDIRARYPLPVEGLRVAASVQEGLQTDSPTDKDG